MFPLGSVLVPGMLLPLHVFEPRYRALVHDCMAGDGEFGVVLIERGSEVGGGDVRTGIGTVAHILRVEQLQDGRFALAAVGTRRLRVTEWLDDDPYPRAEVADWPDGADDPAPAGRPPRRWAPEAASPSCCAGRPRWPRSWARRRPPVDLELADDPGLASFQAVAVAPLGPADRQALLATPTVAARAALLGELLEGTIELLSARLAAG
jgi:Lon protease-like protein